MKTKKIPKGIFRGGILLLLALPLLICTQAQAACTLNAIACENQLVGNPPSEWDVTGAGDTTIQGFATDASVNVGTTVQFKIKTAATAWHIDIYRIGYYGGNGARKITTINATAAQSQPACLTQPTTTGLVDCGNWAVTKSWAVPATAVSGVYVARLVRNDTLGASHIMFIVRNDTSTSSILYQTSDTTWAAYNDFGGWSLYTGVPGSIPGQVGDVRAYKVSLNRPNILRGNQFARTNFFADEFPMVRWLERSGYDVSYISGVDTDRSGALLLNHQIFMDSGHDEYVSAAQRTNEEAARTAGKNMAYFAGNDNFWKTRWENSISTPATARRTMVSYKETFGQVPTDPLDPPTWTGTWRDPRFSPPADGGKPENALTGTIYTINCCNAAAIVVPADYGKMRFWRNTPVATQAAGTSLSLTGGTIGYEFNEDLDNGARPAGLMNLSRTTLSVASKLTDFGVSYAAGTAVHAITLYRAAGGGLVFSTGTVRWSWGLDSVHDDGSSVVDSRMQQATVNLFADMGAQPQTLTGQPGVSLATKTTDVTKPVSVITVPAGATTKLQTAQVTVSGTATDVGGLVMGVEVSLDNGATWHRATGRATWTYTGALHAIGATTIRSRAVDDSGNIEIPGAGKAMTVNCPCNVFGSSIPGQIDAADASSVQLGMKFKSDVAGWVTGVRFYKSAANVGTVAAPHKGYLWSLSGTQPLASATFTGETASGWQSVNFATPVLLTAGQTYIVSYVTPVGHYSADNYGFFNHTVDNLPLHGISNNTSVNGVFSPYVNGVQPPLPTQTFKATNYWVDANFTNVGPIVSATVPASGATGVAVAANLTATFDKAITAATLSFTLKDENGVNVPGATTYNATTRVATFNPTANLVGGTGYTATVTASDAAGNVMPAPYLWSFTSAGFKPCPCSIWAPSATPANPLFTDTAKVELGVKFTADVAGRITAIRFYKGGTATGATHKVTLWNSAGTLLATATSTTETASGWQQVNFATPVAVTAGTTYVASYFAGQNVYAFSSNYFSVNGVDRAPLHALSNVTSPNGVFLYNAVSAFPTQASGGTNYWVDVVFVTP